MIRYLKTTQVTLNKGFERLMYGNTNTVTYHKLQEWNEHSKIWVDIPVISITNKSGDSTPLSTPNPRPETPKRPTFPKDRKGDRS